MSIQTSFGDRIRLAREKRGWSLEALAAKCGLKKNSIQKIETETRFPSLDTAVRLALALGLDLDSLARPTPVRVEESETWPESFQDFFVHQATRGVKLTDQDCEDLLSIRFRCFRPSTLEEWIALYFVLNRIGG